MIKFFYQNELKKLLEISKKNLRDHLIILLSYRHGLRASEVGKIRLNDIDFENKKIYIHRLKNGIPSLHPLPDDEVKLLREYIKKYNPEEILFYGKNKKIPISRKTLHSIIKKYSKEAGIPVEKAHFHTLRHSLGVHLIEAGVDTRVVQSILGHKNIQNTVIYTQIADSLREREYLKALSSKHLI